MTQHYTRSPSVRSSATLGAAVIVGLTGATMTACSTPGENSASSDTAITTTITSSPETSHTPEPSTSTVTAAPETSTLAATADTPDGASPYRQQSAPDQVATTHGLSVTDIRTGEHETMDRVVFEFVGTGHPSWIADWTTEPRQQASGQPMDVEGDRIIEVLISGVGTSLETGRPDIPVGKVNDAAAAGTIASVVHAGTVEGQSQYFIGVTGGERQLTVSTAENPTRLIVDVAHPA